MKLAVMTPNVYFHAQSSQVNSCNDVTMSVICISKYLLIVLLVRVQQMHKSDGAHCLRKKIYNTQNRVNGVFLDPKSLFLNFSLNLLEFLEIVPNDKH